ncbi:phosphoenolpyruvate carboxylase, partial [Candidatus Gottesmanbacteria bacterium]|nr:phosphoenolpyruvate carboxylase [Candidatus Gottesmanbacteria bacterium]
LELEEKTKIKLTRAIPFCAALYSLGIPPELIGTGRGIREAKKQKIWDLLYTSYLHLTDDLLFAGHFLNKDNIIRLAKKANFWYEIMEDIKTIEQELQISLGPVKSDHFEHYKLTGEIYKRFKDNEDVSQLITSGGVIRKSLG